MRSYSLGIILLLSSSTLCAATLIAGRIDPEKHTFGDIYYMQQHNTYDHGENLIDWLDRGFGAVELDVIDKGNWEYWESGPYVSHSPGARKKNCSGNGNTQLGHCFDDLIDWIDKNNPDYPIVVLVDMKINWDPASAWKHDEVGLLDEWISQYLGRYMYRFSDYLNTFLLPKARISRADWAQMPAENVRSMTKEFGWPLLRDLKGKVIVVLTGGKLTRKNQNFRSGWNWLWSNRGVYPATFMCPQGNTAGHIKVGGRLSGMSEDESQRFICNNMGQAKHYQKVANEAARNNQMIHIWGNSPVHPRNYEYNYLALAHGVQFINREDGTPAKSKTWNNSIPLVGVRRTLPGYFKIYNALSGKCLAVENNRYANGVRLVSQDCQNVEGQEYGYTAESQLRPKGNSQYCVDIRGGKARDSVSVHLWDCDGGASERWSIKRDGSFTNWHSYNGGRYGNGFCLDNNFGSDGKQFIVNSCSNSPNAVFELIPVQEWSSTDR